MQDKQEVKLNKPLVKENKVGSKFDLQKDSNAIVYRVSQLKKIHLNIINVFYLAII